MSGNQRLRIGIDCRTLRPPAADGIATYTRSVTQVLAGQSDVEVVVFCFAEALPFLPDAVRARAVVCPAPYIPIVSSHLLDAWRMRQEKIDVLFVPGGHQPLFSFIPTVVVVHDVLIFDHPEWFPQQVFALWLTKRSLATAKQLIAVSHTTARAVDRIFGNRLPLTVVYPGVPIASSVANVSSLQPRPYALVLGTLEPRKNVPFVLHAFLQARSNIQHPIDLIIAGRRGWRSDAIEQELASAYKQTEGAVRWLGPVNDTNKVQLLAGARMLLFPSLNEGFGLPPIEAQAIGTPVVASDIPILRETTGDGAIFVDPADIDALCRAIVRVETDNEFRDELIARGKQNVARYDWQRTAREVIWVCRVATGEQSDTHLQNHQNH